jgi:hypothetical protein
MRKNNQIKAIIVFLLALVLFSNNVKAQPCPPSMTLSTTNATSVSANDGQGIVQVLGGIGPFTYYWEDLSTVSPASGPTVTSAIADTFFNAPSGTYTLALMDAGCPSTFLLDTITITAPGGTLLYNGNFNLCGTLNTSITAYFSGCSSQNPTLLNQYTLSDTNGTIFLDTVSFADSIVLSSLTAGTYVLSVVNYNNGCTAQDTFVISANSLLTTLITTNVMSNSNLGTASITALGGTPPYTIFWDDGSGGQVLPTWTNGDTLTNLPTGTYTFFISDSSVPSCQTSGTLDIFNACSAQLIDNYGPCNSIIYLDAVMLMLDTSI